MPRKAVVTRVLFFLFLLTLISPVFTIAEAAPNRPFPQHVAYAPNTIKPNHRSQAQLDADVRAFYDYWKAKYLVRVGYDSEGRPLYRISFGSSDPGRTVSEGQGYGMVIVSVMAGHDPNARTIFDGLARFARRHPSVIDGRLMDWEWYKGDGRDASAFDGDADIAYGLLLAHSQWGSAGALNYRAMAERVLSGALASTIGPRSRLPMLGDWVERNGEIYNQYTPRSSDFMPSHFRAFHRFTGNRAWEQAIGRFEIVVNSIQTNHSPETGLLPDFIIHADRVPRPAYVDFLEGEHDGHFYYNAGRVPWRIGLDALLNDNPTSRVQVRRMTRWMQKATGSNPANIKAGYELDGAPIGDYFTSFFAAPFGVAAMCIPYAQRWLNRIYDSVYKRHEDYYEDSVTLLCLLVMSGNFWDPTQ